MNPVDEYLKVKEAQPPLSFMARARGALPYFAASTAAYLGGNIALDGLRAAHRAVTKKRDFNQMLEHNPDLQEARQDNPKQFNQMFKSLRSMSPEFSADPLVAGTYMRRMISAPQTAGMLAVEALGARRGMAPQLAIPPQLIPKVPGIPTAEQAETEQLRVEEARRGEGEAEQRADIASAQAEQQAERARQAGELHPFKRISEEMRARETLGRKQEASEEGKSWPRIR